MREAVYLQKLGGECPCKREEVQRICISARALADQREDYVSLPWFARAKLAIAAEDILSYPETLGGHNMPLYCPRVVLP